MNSLINMLDKVCTLTPEEFYEKVDSAITKREKMFIVTANPEIIMLGRSNDTMYDILMRKAHIIPDGIGVVKGANLIGKSKIQRNPGIELVEHLLETGSEKKYKIFLYGSKEKVLNDFMKKCNMLYPGINFVGLYNGYTYTDEQMKAAAVAAKADIYLAALGTPHQELFINEIIDEIEFGVCVGIGGSIDVLSGNVERAPKFFLKHNLEWLYRITKQPKRFGRFFRGNICFVFVLIKELIEKGIKSEN